MSTYYTNSKELKPQILNPNHITESYDIIKFYIKTRYSQELELSSYTQSANKEIINIKRELNESAISIRRITDVLKLVTSTTEEGKAQYSDERFFSVLISTLDNEATKNLYNSEKHLILNCVNKIILLNEKILKFKENYNIILRQLRDEIINAGIPFNIIKIKYNEFKINLRLLESEGRSDLELFRSEEFQQVMLTFDIPFIECFEEIAKEKLNQFVKSDQCVDFKNNLS